jgi:phosphoglycolate phosphatase
MRILDKSIKVTRPKTILFDWDNTLVDSLDIIHAALNDTFSRFNLAPLSREEFRRGTHISARDFIKQYFPEDRYAEVRQVFVELYDKLSKERLELLSDAKEALHAVQSKGIKMAIVSNKGKTLLLKELERAGLVDYFLTIVGSGDLEVDKPSPLPALKALKDIGIDPSHEVWFFGDSATDMETAHNANCLPVFFGEDDYTAEHYKHCPPKVHFLNHKELIKYLSSLDE